jgi:oxygen-independent coproporphyrinogen-3 oxidase
MFSLYFHIPFCKKKCGYCDFYSITNENLTNKFIDALKKEILLRKSDAQVGTIFFGGGTPSILTPNQLSEIADFIRQNFNLSPDCEWTMEVNPESFTDKKAEVYLKNGINRLSIGIQSLNDGELKICGRIHDGKRATQVLRSAILQEFNSVNVDLIYGLPQQDEKSFLQTLETILKIRAVKHVSLYELTINKSAAFGKNYGDYDFPSAEIVEKTVKSSRDYLKENGFERYEVSNFAKEGHRCRHNENYWNCGKYLGFGPSAHSFDGENKRGANIADVEKYCEKLNKNELASDFSETLSLEQKKTEFLMLRLRTSGGFALSEFSAKFGCDFLSENKKYVDNLIENAYMFIENGFCKLTDKGLDIADGIAVRLL